MISWDFSMRKLPTVGLDKAIYERKLSDGTQGSTASFEKADKRVVVA